MAETDSGERDGGLRRAHTHEMTGKWVPCAPNATLLLKLIPKE